jgi:mannose-6-phosphate isomerase-like protein (cupin superfamily)
MELEFGIVKRNAIPAITSVEHDGVRHALGELRDFRWSEKLKAFMPDAAEFSVSWVALRHGETLAPHVHPIQSMMIVYSGSGEMLGDLERTISEGDIVVVPPGRQHGFTGGPAGLCALSIQFGEGLYTAPERPRVVFSEQENSLDALLAYNAERAAAFAERPIFELLTDGTLEHGPCFDSCASALRTWRHGIRSLLLLREANASDPTYEGAFRRGAEAQVADREGSKKILTRDPAIEAIAGWFTYQMYLLDDAEKVVITHLVLDSATSMFDERAARARSRSKGRRLPGIALAGVRETTPLAQLLQHESPRGYARLKRVAGEAWDMIEAMTDRVVSLTRAAR